MFWTPFKIVSKKFLGIDIGTSFIKIVELSSFRERRNLENYGEIAAQVLYHKPFRTLEKSTLLLSSQDIARAIKAVTSKAKMKTRQVIFSIPDFSSFFTNFELPPMSKEELPQAIRYEASQHVPLPLGEVTIDWQVIGGQVTDGKKEKLKILLVAVPNEIINQYRKIAEITELQLFALEAEVFGLVRSLVGERKEAIGLVDIGDRSTTCSIIEKRILKISHSFDLSGNELTERIVKGLSVDYKTAENLKRKQGLQFSQLPATEVNLPLEKGSVREILLPLIDLLLREIEQIFRNFYQNGGQEIQRIILAGGSALLPGLKEYFADHFSKNVEIEIADPFSHVFCPPILEKSLKKMGPSYAIAVGMALRGLE